MYIHFDYKGSTYNADLTKENDEKILVSVDNQLGKVFGTTHSFFVKDKSVEFNTPNRCHSDLFALNSSISRAIAEQCQELLS